MSVLSLVASLQKQLLQLQNSVSAVLDNDKDDKNGIKKQFTDCEQTVDKMYQIITNSQENAPVLTKADDIDTILNEIDNETKDSTDKGDQKTQPILSNPNKHQNNKVNEKFCNLEANIRNEISKPVTFVFCKFLQFLHFFVDFANYFYLFYLLF